MIAQSTIQTVREANIFDVVSPYVNDLKAKGNQYKAKCPFHTENSPSFTVTPSKNIFKCYGCGAGGDGISFVQKHENVNFLDAVKIIAEKLNIHIDYEKLEPGEVEKRQEENDKKKSLQIVLNWASAMFQDNDIPKEYAKYRKLKKEEIKEFKLGYMGSSVDQSLVKLAQKAQISIELLLETDLIQKSNFGEGYFDSFRDRMIHPIMDESGHIVAFSARRINEPTAEQIEAKKEPPKFLNSSEKLYVKGNHLYGLYQAKSAIKDMGFAYLVEGNMDVVQCHQHGLKNTVGTLGTSLTENQIKLLKKYTNKVTIIPDNDKPKEGKIYGPGIAAMMRNAELFIKQGFYVKVLLPIEGEDPDSMLKKHLQGADKREEWQKQSKDYITDWLLKDCQKCIPKDDIGAMIAQINRMADVVNSIPEEMQLKAYLNGIRDAWPDFKKNYKTEKKEANESSLKVLDKLKTDQKRDTFDFGFFEQISGNGCVSEAYYKLEKTQKVRICTFTMRLLYFVGNTDDPKYVIEFKNIFGEIRLTSVRTDDLTSVGSFKKVLGRLGGVFEFEGKDEDLTKIKIKLFYGVKHAHEPIYMGWNKGGKFYTWANGIYFNKEFIKADKYGMVELKRPIDSLAKFMKLNPLSQIYIGDMVDIVNNVDDYLEKMGTETMTDLISKNQVFLLSYYFLPFASRMKSDDEKDDSNEMKKMLKHFLVPGLDFSQWATLMVEVYGKNGMVSVAYFIAIVFRDIIFEANRNYFPILYYFGMRQSGKSKAGESLAAMFGEFMPDGINVEEGSTPIGIRRFMSSVQNALIFLNEYKNTVDKKVRGMLKGIADGSGKLQGQKTSGTETVSFMPRSSALLCGQDLPTADPALLSRCICLEFSDKHRNEEKYHQLKDAEKEGKTTAVTCEILNYRDIMLTYPKHVKDFSSQIKKYLKEDIKLSKVEDRTVNNIMTLLLTFKLISENTDLKLPFTYEELKAELVERVKGQVDIQNSSDDIEQYFFVLTSLNSGKFPTIKNQEHYKIERDTKTNKNVLFLRVKAVHGFYLEAASKQGIVPLGISTISAYLSKHDTFLSYEAKNVGFKEILNYTSAYRFDYDKLLERGIEFGTTTNLGGMVNEQFFAKFKKKEDEKGEDIEGELTQVSKNEIDGDFIPF